MNPANQQLVPSAWLYDFLKGYERFRPTAYKPTNSDKWTLGYGHTKGVKEGDTCTMAQALEWLHQDALNAVMEVRRLVTVPLTQNEFDALVSLIFNCGSDPLTHTLGHMLNAGNKAGAADQFKRWHFQAGKDLPGLTPRRMAERAHFLLAA